MEDTNFNYKGILLIVFFVFVVIVESKAQPFLPDNPNVVIHKSNLPLVFVNTFGNEIKKDTRISARIKIINNADGVNYGDTMLYKDQQVDLEAWAGIKYRGNTSFSMSPKKPLSFKLLTDSYENGGGKMEKPVLNMGNDNDWCLLAPYNDRSLIRDVLTFTLAEPYLEYTPKAKFCELIIDGVYYGVYICSERVRKGKDRLDIKKPGDTGDKLTGGYLLEVDRDDEPIVYESRFPPRNSEGYEFVNDKIYIQYKNPDYEEITEAQKNYIDNRIYEFEESLASEDFKDPENGYRRFVDVASFIDYQLTTEISNNIDGYRQSTYIYKYRDSVDPRFKMSIWDFNIAWGVADFPNIHTGYKYDVWAYLNNDEGLEHKMPFWFGRLMQDESYVNELKNRYYQYRKGRYSSVNEIVDSLVNVLTEMGAADRNFEAWKLWDVYVWPNYNTFSSWEEEIDYLKNWTDRRLAWMDEQLGYNPPTGIVNNKKISNNVSFYSVDGIKQKVMVNGFNIVRDRQGKAKKIFKKSKD